MFYRSSRYSICLRMLVSCVRGHAATRPHVSTTKHAIPWTTTNLLLGDRDIAVFKAKEKIDKANVQAGNPSLETQNAAWQAILIRGHFTRPSSLVAVRVLVFFFQDASTNRLELPFHALHPLHVLPTDTFPCSISRCTLTPPFCQSDIEHSWTHALPALFRAAASEGSRAPSSARAATRRRRHRQRPCGRSLPSP